MGNDQRKPKSWMNPTGGGVKKNPAPSQKREWHPTTQAAKPGEPRKRSRLLPAIAGGLLLAGIVVAVLLLRGYDPARVVLVAPPNTGTMAIPHNWTGFHSAKEIARFAGEGRSHPNVVQEPVDSVKPENWASALDGREKVFAVFFCLHGGTDSKGAYLWLMPPDAGSPDEKYKLRLTKVLDKLAEFPDKKKVLFIDATQVTASLPQGMLHNDFARELRKLDGRIQEIPNLVVICSSDEDQRSWYSEEWQRTVFVHFLVEGARGAANTDRVSVEKLFNFVKDKVSAWVRSNREEEQVPFILPTAGGMELARDIELASTSSSSYKADSPPGANFEAPPELVRAWEQCEEIARYSPQANAPHLWRRHLDLMLRVESLLRAGASVADVQKQLNDLRDNRGPLTTRSWPNLGSLPNSVAMPAAVSAAPSKPLIDRARFLDLWADPPKVWEQLQAAVGPADLPQLRLDVCTHLIDFLIQENRPEYLNQSTWGTKEKPGLLSVIFSGSTAPVEAQFLLILDRDLGHDPNRPRPDWKTLQLALETHRLAEQVALLGGGGGDELPYSELVYPWIKKDIEQADVLRLSHGDDPLISDNPADWTTAAARLGEAKRKYLEIRDRAAQVRAALDARNKALAELPYFARWVAGLSDEFEGDNDRPEKLLKLVEAIAADMHLLASMLEGSDSSTLPKLTATTKRTQAGLEELRRIFFDSLENLGAKDRPSKWRHLDNALQVPFILTNQRMRLLANLRHISRTLNEKFENVTTPPAAKSASSAQERALRQGRIALALLGSTWIDDAGTQDELKGIVKYKFEVLQKMMSPSTAWHEAVAEAGEQLGWHWRTLASRVDALTEKANREALDPALKMLARADALARLTDSATAFTTERDPAGDYLRHRLHWFLLDQARRTIQANWAAADPAVEKAGTLPSFAEETGRRFVKDAEDLIMMGAAKVPSQDDTVRLQQEVRPLKARLDKLPTHAVSPAQRFITVTSRQKIDVRFSFQSPVGQAPGYPVLQFLRSGPCKLAPDLAMRTPITAFVDQNQATVDRSVELQLESNATKEHATVTAELWHRGHRPSGTSTIVFESQPSGSWAHRTPQGDGALIPRAGEEMRKGTIGIVLDWTRSMVTPPPTDKYTPAIDALEALLAVLPEETEIALMQFGDPDNNTKDKMVYPEPIRGLYCGKRYVAKRDNLIKRLRGNVPDAGATPLARAILKMAEFMARIETPGTKTIVVLTDGEDNVPQVRGVKWEPGKWLVEEMKDFPMAVNMVFIQAGNEEKNALDQFEPLLRARPPGALYTANDRKELIDNLRDALIPRIVILDENQVAIRGLQTRGRDGVKVLSKESGLKNPIWLPAGSYGLRTARGDLTKFVLPPGDRLQIEPYYKGERVAIRPLPYITTVPSDYPRGLRGTSKEIPDLQAAVADAHLVPGKAGNREYDLELVILMERDRAPDPLQVTRPDFAWIEVRAASDDPEGPPRMAWMENANYYPCPAWKVTVPNWPHPGKDTALQGCPAPVISAYWLQNWPIGKPVVRPEDKDLQEAFKQNMRVGEENVDVVEVRFDQDTLVVDLAYKKGPPVVFVRTEGLSSTPRLSIEEDHRFFNNSGRYTARFSKVDENRRRQKFSLVFYSIAELKSKAARIDLQPTLILDTKAPFEPTPELIKPRAGASDGQ